MKKLELSLSKDESGITAITNDNVIAFFDDSDESRKDFIKFLLEEFINKEVENGVKYF